MESISELKEDRRQAHMLLENIMVIIAQDPNPYRAYKTIMSEICKSTVFEKKLTDVCKYQDSCEYHRIDQESGQCDGSGESIFSCKFYKRNVENERVDSGFF